MNSNVNPPAQYYEPLRELKRCGLRPAFGSGRDDGLACCYTLGHDDNIHEPPKRPDALELLDNEHFKTHGDCPWPECGYRRLRTAIQSLQSQAEEQAKLLLFARAFVRGSRSPGFTREQDEWLASYDKLLKGEGL